MVLWLIAGVLVPDPVLAQKETYRIILFYCLIL